METKPTTDLFPAELAAAKAFAHANPPPAPAAWDDSDESDFFDDDEDYGAEEAAAERAFAAAESEYRYNARW